MREEEEEEEEEEAVVGAVVVVGAVARVVRHSTVMGILAMRERRPGSAKAQEGRQS